MEAVTDPDREARVWLDGDASRLGEFEPYDWGGQDPYTLGEPVWGLLANSALAASDGDRGTQRSVYRELP